MKTYADTAHIEIETLAPPHFKDAAREPLSKWEWGKWCPPMHEFVFEGRHWELLARSGENHWVARPGALVEPESIDMIVCGEKITLHHK